jgi:molybdopterin-containing oxidoreductase family membrane subunit
MALVFDANGSRPLWHTSSFALFFIISAIAGGFGVALMMIFLNNVAKIYKNSINVLSKALFFLLTFMLVIDFWNVVINSYSSDILLGATMKLFTGNGVLAHNFYFYEIILGILVPMFLLLIGRFKSTTLSAIAGILTVIGLFFSRYDAVIGGQLLSRPNNNMDFILHTYNVSSSEISLFIGSIGVLLIIYFLGAKFFNLEESTL